ncbi:subunit of TIM23 translocase complex [Pleurotus pulmonarius]|nr:subunit of TIM23 translocase complex [Pleurotus pulmonarius]
MGALMGSGVGLTIGFIFGSYSILRGGAGPRGALSTLSQYMLSSAATFSFFLAIGSVCLVPAFNGVAWFMSGVWQVIRTDTLIPPHLQAVQMQLTPAMVLRSRIEGARLVRERWAAERKREA